MSNRIHLNVPFPEKDEAKALGARWDPAVKKWHISQDENFSLFSRWLPSDYETTIGAHSKDDDTDKKHLTIREIKSKVQLAVSRAYPEEIWVVGEIIKIKKTRGAIHIELQDDEAMKISNKAFTLRTTAWSQQASYIENKLQNEAGLALTENQKVRLKVKLEFHDRAAAFDY